MSVRDTCLLAPLRVVLLRLHLRLRFALLAQILASLTGAEDFDWSKCKIWFADERCVPLDHSDR